MAITDVRCRPSDSRCGAEEYARENEIVFPRSGCFLKHLGRRSLLADPNHVIFFNRHEPYRVSHPVGGGDKCTAFSFSREMLAGAFGSSLATTDDSDASFPLTHCPIGGEVSLALHGLRRRLLVGPCERLEVDEMSVDLLRAVAGWVHRRLDHSPADCRPATRRRRRAIVADTRLLLGRTYRDPLSLKTIAAKVGSSPFHLIRIFRKKTGMPVHRYRGLLRLREALERLTEGEEDLTTLALDLGYCSHSHFTDSFRAAFGTSPSAYRRHPSGSPLRKLSKILEA